MFYVGLGKTLFNSSACLFRPPSGGSGGRPEIELALSERLLRKKATGAWPEVAIRSLELGQGPMSIAENRDVHSPADHEDAMNRGIPFYDYLARQGLARYSRHFNQGIEPITHHRCHAMAAVAMSPFDRCVVLVMDGAGSLRKDFLPRQAAAEPSGDPSLAPDSHEECSVYLHDRGTLRCVRKRWRIFRRSERHPEQTFSEGPGILYEKAAEYIFNSGRAAGKVMGLAPFGRPAGIGSRTEYLDSLDWSKAFKGKTKTEWEKSGRFSAFADIAASVQQDFETGLLDLAREIREAFPEYENLILAGGCALNCTANRKLLEASLFREIYVPPFPGDECIGFGAASELYYARDRRPWQPLHHEDQHGYYGLVRSIPAAKAVERAFAGLEIVRPGSIAQYVADLLAEGKILAWFHGRSESGPRALGNRSILASPAVPAVKDRLNRDIKLREAFRPYGASCLHEDASKCFQVPAGFNSPYMSFAVLPREAARASLREVCHVDGTSRIQTVRPGQNRLFHELLSRFKARTGIACLLNTSLNVMGEPIVETVEDSRRFLDQTPVHGIAVGDFYVRSPR